MVARGWHLQGSSPCPLKTTIMVRHSNTPKSLLAQSCLTLRHDQAVVRGIGNNRYFCARGTTADITQEAQCMALRVAKLSRVPTWESFVLLKE